LAHTCGPEIKTIEIEDEEQIGERRFYVRKEAELPFIVSAYKVPDINMNTALPLMCSAVYSRTARAPGCIKGSFMNSNSRFRRGQDMKDYTKTLPLPHWCNSRLREEYRRC